MNLAELAAACCVILQIKNPVYLLDEFSPALCHLIYRTRQREMLREKLIDLRVTASAATNSGMVTNASEIIGNASETLREMIRGGS
jgi:hypothetical protein